MYLSEAETHELTDLKNKLGRLSAADIVEQARSSNSALHGRFEWDDKTAANAYRWQVAFAVSRAYVRVTQAPSPPSSVRVVTQVAPTPRSVAVATIGGDRITKFWEELRGLVSRYDGEPFLAGDIRFLRNWIGQQQKEATKPTPAQVAQTRKCLRCTKEFQSTGAGNRMCTSCAGVSAGVE